MVANKTVLFGLALIVGLLLVYRRAPIWWIALCLVWPALAGYELLHAVRSAWPPRPLDVSLLRATVAAVAACALLRERFAPPRFPAHRGMILSVLGLCGLLSFLAFYNLGSPQFENQARQEGTYVHLLDHRQYFTTAKYFPEIGYRGIYFADAAAYFEDQPNERESIAKWEMRNLLTHWMSTIGDQAAEIEAVRARFTAVRWESYKRDARYFREALGRKPYFGCMIDYGGNATPVWIGIAHLIYNRIVLSDASLTALALLDPLLLAIAFIAIWRCFGVKTMLVCLTVFGANDFTMYGSNWAGATLRHDWMAYLALGACALRRERWLVGGLFLGLAAMIRAFPALALAAMALPALWWIYDFRVSRERFPSVAEFRGASRGPERAFLAAMVTAAALFVGTGLLFSFGVWADWWEKVRLLGSQPHANHIGLRSLIAGWFADQPNVLMARMPLYLAALALCLGSVVAAARGKRPDQAAILGLVLIPVLFYPANYYLHFVFLLPLLMADGENGVGVTVLLLCVAQYFTVPIEPVGGHFYQATVLLFAALAALVGQIIRGDVRERLWARPS